MWSPICNVGSIEPEGMKNVWTTNARRSTATRTAITTTMTASLIQRVGWGSSGGGSAGFWTSGGSTEGGSSTASTGSFWSGVTGGRLDAAAGARGSGGGWDHRGRVAAGTQEGARQRAGGGAVTDGLDPVDEDPDDPVRAGVEPGSVPRQVVHEPGGLGVDRLRVEDEEVRDVALANEATVAQTEQLCRLRREHVHGLLHRDQLAAAQAIPQEGGRIARAAHAVEVRARVGPADHGARVAPDLRPQSPRRFFAVVGVGPQDGAQIVGQHDVEEGVERSGPPFRRDVGDGAERASLVGSGVGVP